MAAGIRKLERPSSLDARGADRVPISAVSLSTSFLKYSATALRVELRPLDRAEWLALQSRQAIAAALTRLKLSS